MLGLLILGVCVAWGVDTLSYVAVILELAHEQGWDRFQLVGHSLGGSLATLVAGLHPEKVSRLVLVDSIGPLSGTAEQTRTTVARYLSTYLSGKDHPIYRSRDQAVRARAQLACIRAITAPTLLVKADRSALVEEYYPARIAAVPDLRQVTLPGGHHLHIENADAVAAVVRQLLSDPVTA